MHCRELDRRLGDGAREDDDDDEARPAPRRLCNRKRTWRTEAASLQAQLPCTMSPDSLVKGLYWFLASVKNKVARDESGLTDKAFRKLNALCRMAMAEELEALQAHLPQLGGPGKIVCVDETFFTRKRNCRGGFRGRVTAGHRTIVLGMTEIGLEDWGAAAFCR